MAENEEKPNGNGDEGLAGAGVGDGAGKSDQPQAGMLAQYVKDLSFENPNAPQSLQRATEARPAINLNVNVNARQLGADSYEVEMKLEASATHDDKVAFVVDLVFAGLFGIRNVPREALEPFLLVEAPHLLFPFARRILADAVRDGGFSPLMLEPIDFAGLYRQQLAQRQGEGGGIITGGTA
ncbi:MAG: protein-export chaperone SecB [Pseudomonadota bacterium]